MGCAKLKLKYFESEEDVKAFIETEIVYYLRDELDLISESYERRHYTNDDRRVLRHKIHDVEAYLDQVANTVTVTIHRGQT